MVTANGTAVEVREFDPGAANEGDWRAAHKLMNALHAERKPEDPQNSLEQTIRQIKSIPGFIEHKIWAAWAPENAEAIGYAIALMFREGEENKHLVQVEGGVLPGWRRQGIGTRLLEMVARLAEEKSKRLLIIGTSGTIPAGAAFMARIGARVGLESHENELDLEDLNRDLVGAWIERGESRNPEFKLGLWEGPYPEDEIQDIVKLMETTNTAPRGDLEVEDFRYTPEQIRQQEAAMEQRRTERWTIYARDTTNGELAGFTEVFWSAEKAALLFQGFTAVWPHYRNRSLGRWLKAAMLDKVLRERPQVRVIRTGNADSNAAMLKINYELGFKPSDAELVWQVEVGKVREYLAEREA